MTKIRKNKPISADDLLNLRIKHEGKRFFLKTPEPNRRQRRSILQKERFKSNKAGKSWTIVGQSRFLRHRHKVEVWETRLVKGKDVGSIPPENLITNVIKKNSKGKKYKNPKTVYREKVVLLGHRYLENYYSTKKAA